MIEELSNVTPVWQTKLTNILSQNKICLCKKVVRCFGNETKSRVFLTATKKNVTTRDREVTKHASTPHNVIYDATANEGEPRDELFSV